MVREIRFLFIGFFDNNSGFYVSRKNRVEIYYILILEFLVYIFQISFFFPFMEGKDMGEICELIGKIKRNKEDFYLIVERFSPLINKYTKLLYKDEKEDVYEELVAALWEAIQKMVFYENDGQIVNYLSTAMKNKYMELYRISRRLHDHVVEMTSDKAELAVNPDDSYDNILIQMVCRKYLKALGKIKKNFSG